MPVRKWPIVITARIWNAQKVLASEAPSRTLNLDRHCGFERQVDDCGGEYHAEPHGSQAQNQADQAKLSQSQYVTLLAGIEHRLLD